MMISDLDLLERHSRSKQSLRGITSSTQANDKASAASATAHYPIISRHRTTSHNKQRRQLDAQAEEILYSNDPEDVEDAAAALINGWIYEYSCERKFVEPLEALTELPIYFRYEFLTLKDTVVTTSSVALEARTFDEDGQADELEGYSNNEEHDGTPPEDNYHSKPPLEGSTSSTTKTLEEAVEGGAVEISNATATVNQNASDTVVPPPEDNDNNLPSQLPAIEWGMLWTVAYELGLTDCNDEAGQIMHTGGFRDRRRNRRLSEDEDEDEQARSNDQAKIVALSSLEVDRVDPAGCEHLTAQFNLDYSKEDCYSMQGMMTLKFAGNQNEAYEVAEYIQSMIQDKVNGQDVLIGGVTHAVYLGAQEDDVYIPQFHERGRPVTPTLATPPEEGNSQQVSANGLQSMTWVIAGVAVAAALFIILGVFLAFRKRRDRQSDEAVQPSVVLLDEDPGKGVGVVSVQAARAASPVLLGGSLSAEEMQITSGASSPEHTQVLLSTSSGGATLPTSNKSLRAAATPPKASSDTSSSDDTSTNADSRTDSGTADDNHHTEIQDFGTNRRVVVDVLPPLPPNGPSSKPPPSAKTMKRRRRKKKRPKTTIKRVNSRENINEMETIAEVAEKSSDDDSDYDGSEYSWSTEGSDSPIPSRDASPVRSMNSSAGSDKAQQWEVPEQHLLSPPMAAAAFLSAGSSSSSDEDAVRTSSTSLMAGSVQILASADAGLDDIKTPDSH